MAKQDIMDEMDDLSHLAMVALGKIAVDTGKHPVNVALAMATVALDVKKTMGQEDPEVPALLAVIGHYALTYSADDKVTH